MVILILLFPDEPGTVMFPRVIVAQPVTDVGVNDGVVVNVVVGVKVGVLVNVLVGRGVLVGKGVLVNTGAAVAGIDVLVGSGVFEGAVVAVGEFVGKTVTGVEEAPGTDVPDESVSSSTSPRKVRALEDVKVRDLSGINFSMGL